MEGTALRDYHQIPIWQNVTEEQWNDWHWQLAHRIDSLDELKQVLELTPDEEQGVSECLQSLRMAITPYFATLIDPQDPSCPLRKQAIPVVQELTNQPYELRDPLHEEIDSPVKGLTHRYPDRVLFLVTDQCAMYCRHCTRRRFTGTFDHALPKEQVDRAIDYIRQTTAIRDVLVSGGDPLLLSDDRLEYVLRELRTIEHVEVIRIGTRLPVTLPQRITPELCSMLSRYHPLWINIHFNHPDEITPQSQAACERLANTGIPLGSQSVLLKGVNDCPHIFKALVQRLVKMRVRPYYIYQCDIAQGLDHFRTAVAKGIEVIEFLRGHTSGFAVPTFVVDAPGGGGKIPLGPQYLVSQSDRKVILRNFEGLLSTYVEPENKLSHCHDCGLCDSQPATIGVARLLQGDEIRLEPAGFARPKRRRNGEPRHSPLAPRV